MWAGAPKKWPAATATLCSAKTRSTNGPVSVVPLMRGKAMVASNRRGQLDGGMAGEERSLHAEICGDEFVRAHSQVIDPRKSERAEPIGRGGADVVDDVAHHERRHLAHLDSRRRQSTAG